ncbi:MAG: hypothetical protein GQ564_12915 [Bacteroidales bacterium]|nr:hypothetical protein [Bacteroidales bacterium]
MTPDASLVVRYQYDNHLGSSSLELDDTAEIISYEEYHPFGTTSYRSGRTETETSQKRYKYVGKERDEKTGLYYYGARYYAAWICRFVSVDPLQFDYPYYTPYQYAGNKPISYIDLDGLEEVKPEEDGSAQKQTELPKSSEDESINKQIQFYFDEYGANGDFSANVESEDGKFVKGSVTMNVGDDIVFTVDLLPGEQVSGILDNNTNQEIGYDQAFGFSIYTPEGGAESATEKAKTTEMMNGEWLAALTSRRASLRFSKGPLTLASAINNIKEIISILMGKQDNQNDQDTQTTPDKDIKPDDTDKSGRKYTKEAGKLISVRTGWLTDLRDGVRKRDSIRTYEGGVDSIWKIIPGIENPILVKPKSKNN